MYTSTYSPSSTSPYTSPPPPSDHPYRSSPIQVAAKQPYTAAFSPPPQMPNAYPMQPGQQAQPQSRSQRYQQYPAPPQQYARAPPGPAPSSRYAQGYPNGYPQQQPPPQRHKGTLAPGQIVRVGDISVRIERYLSEGGYAHVYLTTSDKPIFPPSKSGEKKGRWGEKGYTEHCLKRIAFEDESVWVDVKKEIEVMKSLPANSHLVQYLGHAHSRLPTGGHEVFILMEFVSGGGIIDLLNKRLRDRLKEIEILNIFTDVCEAVAAMHHLPQPLLHRDLKIENVLSQPTSSAPTPQRPSPLTFKLCDFGSTTFPASKPPASKVEADALAIDLNKHTTLQYRSPEMVEPMLGLPVGLPSDVWALGCLLYKLCYYTTPFEEHGPLAIVNAKYSFPPVPVYSPKLQHLIASMLVEQPHRRPSVFEILKVAHEMSGTRPEVDYPIPSRSLAGPSQQRQPSRPAAQSNNLLDFTGHGSPVDKTPVLQPSMAASVQPQRRGRPTREPSQKQVQPVSAPSSLPPMPVPPAQPQPASSSFNSRTQPPQLQVTGDKTTGKPTSPSLDAFGMPSLPTSSSQKSERGFGDSFAAPKPAPTGSSRFGANLPRPPSGFGDAFGVARPPSTSSRTSPRAELKRVPSLASQQNKKQPSPSASAGIPAAQRPSEPSSSIPNGEHNFETRFPSIEMLHAQDEPSRPPSQLSRPKPESLVSPVTSPPVSRPAFTAKPSVMGNMTGGDLRSPTQPTAPVFANQQPQPRSTHVTGTAFNGVQGGMQSPSNQKTDYFGSVTNGRSQTQEGHASPTVSSASAREAPVARDLMDEDNMEGLQVPSIQPGRSTTPLSSASDASRILPSPSAVTVSSARPLPSPGSVGSARSPPLTGHHRPLLPNIDASKPTSNIMSAEWSPLERLRSQGQGPPEPSKFDPTVEVDSSDDEAEPESASGGGQRPWSRTNEQSAVPTSSQKLAHRASAFGGLQPQSSRDKSGKSSTVSIPPVGSASRPGSGAQHGVSGERGRPQSMFITPSSSAKPYTALLSPPVLVSEEPNSLPSPRAEGRPAHGRKGSITDIVSRYESLRPPSSVTVSASATASGSGSSFEPKKPVQPAAGTGSSAASNANGLGRRPSVANKPQALRKSTIDDKSVAQPAPSSQGQSAIAIATNNPLKASSPTGADANATKPKTAFKPAIVAPKPVRHDQTPAPEGYSRSSSGRSFPITKPQPQPQVQPKPKPQPKAIDTSPSDGGPEPTTPADGSRNGSPEKQQPVNLLIQRWNQGQVNNAAANKAPPKKGGYI